VRERDIERGKLWGGERKNVVTLYDFFIMKKVYFLFKKKERKGRKRFIEKKAEKFIQQVRKFYCIFKEKKVNERL
jgi:hypothetical protein